MMKIDDLFVSCIVSELEQLYSNTEAELRNFVVDNYKTFHDDFWHEWHKYCDHDPKYGISGDTSATETFYGVLARIVVNVGWPTYSDSGEYFEQFKENVRIKSKSKFNLDLRFDV